MQIVEQGHGEPLVLIPGLQGRWQYVGPAAEALSRWFRVITFSLCDEPSAEFGFDPARGFDSYVGQVEAALNQAGVDRATICGISFGGLIALRFAADHADRTAALVLTSTPGPSWHLRPRHRLYARLPRVAGPLFLAESPWRVRAEMSAALPSGPARRRFARAQLRVLLTAPLSFRRMASRALLVTSADAAACAARVTAPALVVSGEGGLDHVVSAEGSSEYVMLLPNARRAVLEQTGHLGSITRPDVFAAIVRDFVRNQRHAAA